MGLIQSSSQIADIKDDKEKFRYIQLFLQGVQNVVNGKIEFVSNIRVKIKSVTFNEVDVDKTIEHGLGFVPNGYFIVGLSAAMIVSDGSSDADASEITLKSNAVGEAQVMFF